MDAPTRDLQTTISALEELRARGTHVGHGFAVSIGKSRERRLGRIRLALVGSWIGILLVALGWFTSRALQPLAEEQPSTLAKTQALHSAEHLDAADELFLRGCLVDKSTTVQRLALLILSNHEMRVSTAMLEAMLERPARLETIEYPTEVAGPGAIETAQWASRTMMTKAVLYALVKQASAHGSLAVPRRIEPFLNHHDPTVRMSAATVLAFDPAYRLPPRERAFLEADTDAVRVVARPLLDRK